MPDDIKPVLTDEQILAVGAFGQSPLKRLEHGRAIEREVLRVLADWEGRQPWQPIGTLVCHVSGGATFWPYGARVLHLPVGDHTVYVAPPADAQRAKEGDRRG